MRWNREWRELKIFEKQGSPTLPSLSVFIYRDKGMWILLHQSILIARCANSYRYFIRSTFFSSTKSVRTTCETYIYLLPAAQPAWSLRHALSIWELVVFKFSWCNNIYIFLTQYYEKHNNKPVASVPRIFVCSCVKLERRENFLPTLNEHLLERFLFFEIYTLRDRTNQRDCFSNERMEIARFPGRQF